jgi:hypothetical protein
MPERLYSRENLLRRQGLVELYTLRFVKRTYKVINNIILKCLKDYIVR